MGPGAGSGADRPPRGWVKGRVSRGGRGKGAEAGPRLRAELGPKEPAARTAKWSPRQKQGVRRETGRQSLARNAGCESGAGLSRGRGLGATRERGLRHGRAGLGAGWSYHSSKAALTGALIQRSHQRLRLLLKGQRSLRVAPSQVAPRAFQAGHLEEEI